MHKFDTIRRFILGWGNWSLDQNNEKKYIAADCGAWTFVSDSFSPYIMQQQHTNRLSKTKLKGDGRRIGVHAGNI